MSIPQQLVPNRLGWKCLGSYQHPSLFGREPTNAVLKAGVGELARRASVSLRDFVGFRPRIAEKHLIEIAVSILLEAKIAARADLF